MGQYPKGSSRQESCRSRFWPWHLGSFQQQGFDVRISPMQRGGQKFAESLKTLEANMPAILEYMGVNPDEYSDIDCTFHRELDVLSLLP